eukprot:gnl/MRDRNA2_/MRDRNA2_62155_c0_seq1.p1 gnl/MRDRNA2_/MRDRNA2_62155_c0~~gnl/MRDRNA2_/MRDRNA2_62155_c0_seq1.p1  ORF type:complete len:316 (+),score=58.12 gnl/MRDRNA2_/MRDRNA2_62155_c0_seq1:66-1013(+)
MMRSITLIILFAFLALAQVRAKELAVYHSDNVEPPAGRKIADKASKMFDRAVKVPPLQYDLDNVTLMKPSHLAMPRRTMLKPLPPPTASILHRSSILPSHSLSWPAAVDLVTPWAGHRPQFNRVVSRSRHMQVAATAYSEDNSPSNSSKAAEEIDLDAPMIDDGGLAAAFKKRLDQEGGAEMLKLKTGVADVRDAATSSARKAQRVVTEKVVNPADRAVEPAKNFLGNWWGRLDNNQRTIAKVIGGIIAFRLVLDAVGGSMNTQPQNTYTNRPRSFEEYTAQNPNPYAGLYNQGPGSFEEYKQKIQSQNVPPGSL